MLERQIGAHVRAELASGRLVLLPMPTQSHQLMILFLVQCLQIFSRKHAPGTVLFSGIRVRLRGGARAKYREPDVIYMRAEHAARQHEEFWEGADLVMEIVSGDRKDRLRDWRTKPRDYASAGIPEYWIIDPERKLIRVLSLRGKSYRRHGDFKPGDIATSVTLPGFEVAVNDVFAAGGV